MTASDLHARSIVVDGLNVCNWSGEIFAEWREGGVTAVSCTCAIWENFRETSLNIAQWQRWFREYADLITPVRTVADIHRAKSEGRTGVILSWQNTSSIEDRIEFIGLFRELGVGVMQLTYNTQNYSGCGYVEETDSGLSGFGREVVAEMNRIGVLCDLSHVGDRTAADVIAHSAKPVAYSHVLPRALKDVPRNKPDDLLKAVAEKGGIIGVSVFSPGMPKGNDSNVEDYVDAIDYVIGVVGEDHVGIGTDFSQGHARPGPFMEFANRDKGYARLLTKFGHTKVLKPKGISRIAEMPNVTAAMLGRGWSEDRIRKLLGENWLRVLDQVWSV